MFKCKITAWESYLFNRYNLTILGGLKHPRRTKLRELLALLYYVAVAKNVTGICVRPVTTFPNPITINYA